MNIVMVSGHFSPFHDGHLSYIKQAMVYADILLAVVSSDKQLLMKKGKVNIPQGGRKEIVSLIIRGLNIPERTEINIWDTETTLVAEALRVLRPTIFFRGGDKTIDDMPPDERRVCEELGIEILHGTLEKDTHGSRFS